MADADNKKRYILFSKEDGRPDAEKPCAFFASPAGCRNGAKCKFMHGAPAVVHKKAAVNVESDDLSKQKKERKEKKEKKSREEAPVPPAPQPYVPVQPVQRAPVVPTPRVTVAPVAPAPVAPKPVVKEQDNKLVRELQQKLLEQEKAFAAQMQLMQQLAQQAAAAQAAAPVQAAAVPEPRKENKRKSIPASTAAPLSNKSPKTAAVVNNNTVPTYQQQVAQQSTGFGHMLQSIGQQRAMPVKPVAAPVAAPVVLSSRANNTYANNVADDSADDDDTDFLFGAVNHVLNTGMQNSNNNTPHKVPETNAQTPFVSNTEAVQALQTSGSKHALQGSAKKNIFATSKTQAKAEPAAPQAPRANPAPFNPASVQLASLPWEQLVAATRANTRFNNHYTFAEFDSTWVKAKPYGAWCAQKNLPAVLSMDCEMCETTDPVTGEKVDNALIRFSVVDCNNNGQVLIDALVAPGLPITDARTHIHGITEEQLSTVTWTLRHAQAALLNLCSDRTVFVGHSLHKDLRALKFSHRNVVDTAYLFTLENEPGAAPSLRDVSEQILGTKLPDTHDSVEDARAALYGAAVLLSRGPQLPIVRKNSTNGTVATTAAARTEAAAAAVGTSLLVHRIPDYCTEQHIQEMIVAYTQVMPCKVNPITRGAPTTDASSVPSGKTTIFFSSQIHCDLAFESIAGPNRPDKQNRDQKRVYFKGGGYICVRK